jgi:hypothetical protein
VGVPDFKIEFPHAVGGVAQLHPGERLDAENDLPKNGMLVAAAKQVSNNVGVVPNAQNDCILVNRSWQLPAPYFLANAKGEKYGNDQCNTGEDQCYRGAGE